MHMILRTILIFLRKKFLAKASFSDRTVISMRVLPTDLDILWHVNNGVYFSYMDFGRWDAIFRNGAYDKSRALGWYSVVASETIKFKRSLKLWDRFELHTTIRGHDERYFFIQQRFQRGGELVATGLVKIRFLRRTGGTVPTQEVLAALGDGHALAEVHELGSDWFELERKHID